ncbi:hypothetical protein ABFV99_26675, partial [Cytobacillus horneckiae]|uniref:hypothetical protein n=1 Tax=Cytobacillus horneckiae TaxID=549687 RepID=UPI0034CF48AF
VFAPMVRSCYSAVFFRINVDVFVRSVFKDQSQSLRSDSINISFLSIKVNKFFQKVYLTVLRHLVTTFTILPARY